MRLGGARCIKIVLFLTNLSTIAARDTLDIDFGPTPNLTVSIARRDGRTISFTITNNHHTLPVNVIKWNSILEDFPVARVPFYIRTIQEGRDLDRAPSAHATYVNVLDSHFIQIGPLNPYTHNIHVPSWYAIPATGNYKVRWNGNLRGFLGNHGGNPATARNLKRSDIYKLPRIAELVEQTISLDRSFMPSQVADTSPCEGWPYRMDALQQARQGAIDLANKTQINAARNTKYWKRYFNGNVEVDANVKRVFENIKDYFAPRGGSGFTLVERCATNERAPCGPGVASYTVVEEKTKRQTTIIFCIGFYGSPIVTPMIPSIVLPIRDCDSPGPGITPKNDRDMIDRSGIYLNAFLRSGIPRPGGEDIDDGLYNTCYGHFCAHEAAFLRVDKRFRGSGRPTTPIPDCAGIPNCNLWGEPLGSSDDGNPERIAANFELYAYSMRALSCPENRIRYCSREACENLGDSVATYIQNNLQTLIIGILTPTVVACVPVLFARPGDLGDNGPPGGGGMGSMGGRGPMGGMGPT